MAPTPKSAKSAKPKDDNKNPKPVNEIDEIFQSTKPEKPKEKASKEVEKSGPEKKLKAEGGIKKGKKKLKKNGSGRILDEGSESKSRRRKTNDGLKIYSADELGFGKTEAGGTALCPFDCSCCF